ncbi:hypothetical protein SAMN04488132_11078 [Sediminibacterium ginsengisoli]|uniref:Uncharacterized protein n=2 Tax=Sediminibacterium ginsengisoli TaxID=413434 RepID=A0A1T4R2Y8_9BACT|nr:hypothetical protein SAMN04488132_11078 [Sediminibacterium ginsengisoli]
MRKAKEGKKKALSEPDRKSGTAPLQKLADSSPQAAAHRQWQSMADNSNRVKQLRTYQQMSSAPPVVQRYATELGTGYLVSANGHAILRRDGSKELYMDSDRIADANDALRDKDIENVELTEGETWHHNHRDYSKVVPEFRNVPGQYGSKVSKERGIAESRQQLNYKMVHGFHLTMNFLTKCTRDPWYRAQLTRHRNAAGNIENLIRELAAIEIEHEQMLDGRQVMAQIRNRIQAHAPKDEIRQLLDAANAPQNGNFAKDLVHKLYIYSDDNTLSLEFILQEIDKQLDIMDENIETYNQDVPYLPTSCGMLRAYLVGNTGAQQNGGNIGDYHYIDYNDRNDNGPWNNHYSSIIFRDGGDTVGLEDAAGQARLKERNHWYFKMYGTEEEQQFGTKTTAEYDRRKNQKDRFDEIVGV